LVTHLVLHDTTIEGTITNKLNTALNDVYVLLPHQFAHIARLDAGQTQQVKISLADQPQNGALADAIARQGGLTTPYFPYSKSQQPQNDFQRHAALLSALNGSGFTFQPCQPSCNTHAITDTPRSIIFTTGGNVPHDSTNNDDDPLLIPDAMATLIGWADQPLTDEATINGSHPAGRHESFIQAPLTIDLSQTTQVPAGLLSSRVVDIQGYDAQVILSGLYSLSTASVTFEMQAPGSLPASSYLITQPDLALQPDAQGHAPSGAPSHLRASLYNWHTGSWDPLSFKQPGGGALVTDATSHTGPGGRLLVQISSPDHTPVYFSKPLLAINTTH
ncbi:MAG: hypothetical protein J2P36_35045, partial [Ktedonobacteraceae bacterium]|nr:hypothetical protein [Ktedonobacteraceae bacterium]